MHDRSSDFPASAGRVRMNKRELLAGAGAATALALLPRIGREHMPLPVNKPLYADDEALGADATTGFGIVNGMILTLALVFGRLIGESVFA